MTIYDAIITIAGIKLDLVILNVNTSSVTRLIYTATVSTDENRLHPQLTSLLLQVLITAAVINQSINRNLYSASYK